MHILNKKQLFLFSIYFFSLQFATVIQISNASSVLSFLHAPSCLLSNLWLAGPISGLIFGMLFGQLSDMTVSRFGKRKPYLLIYGILATISLIWFPISSLGGAILLLWLYYIGFNGCQWPFQAWVGDLTPKAQLPSVYSLQIIAGGIGAALAGVSGLLPNYVNVDALNLGTREVPLFLIMAFGIAGVIFFISTLTTIILIKEESPASVNSKQGKKISQHFVILLKSIRTNALHPPGFIKKLFPTQLFVWYAVFSVWVYLPLALAQHFYGLTPAADLEALSKTQQHMLSNATQLAGICYAVASLSGAIFSLFLRVFLKKMKEGLLLGVLLLVGGVSLLSCMIFQSYIVLVISMIGTGICLLGPGLMMIPIFALIKKTSAEKRGVILGVFNITVTIPQILGGLTMGLIQKNFFHNNAVDTMLFAGILVIIGALFAILLCIRE